MAVKLNAQVAIDKLQFINKPYAKRSPPPSTKVSPTLSLKQRYRRNRYTPNVQDASPQFPTLFLHSQPTIRHQQVCDMHSKQNSLRQEPKTSTTYQQRFPEARR